MNKKVFVIILLLAVIVIAITTLFLMSTKKRSMQADYTVTLTEEGFSPKEITIKNGKSVKFITSGKKPFWPASDLHPTHELYSDFDSKNPVNPGDAWVFTFTKSGRWKYHDHLFPYHTGTVIVSE